jgi:uncharacterized membrane protein
MPDTSPKHHRAGNGKQTCSISGKQLPRRQLVSLDEVGPNLAEQIRNDHPELPPDSLISEEVVNKYRARYVEALLEAEFGELGEIEQNVARSLATNATLVENIEAKFAGKRTLGERLSDDLAKFGGSWTFLIAFAVVLGCWVTLNVAQGMDRAFDPYPFILLNLVLSCVAAVQAPIIMMSQKRQEAKDRLRSLNDYQVNLKAELEIRQLHEKIDHLLNRQWHRLVEIQKLQMELMEKHRQ